MPACRTAGEVRRHIESRTLQVPGGCWWWLGKLNTTGYGCLEWSRPGMPRLDKAHRVAFAVYHGEPGNLCVCHTCDNRECVNPDHLFLGTNADNIADRTAKGRSARPNGTKNPNRKLTEDQVRAIRRTYVPGVNTMEEVASIYGVLKPAVWKIVHFKSWPHI